MPGRIFLETELDAVVRWMKADAGDFSQPARRNISPGEEIVVCAPGPVLKMMRWGLIPVGRVNARGRPVLETIINARSETVFDKSAFDGVGRAIVPCNGWYEWTGKTRRKTAWRIQPASGGLMAFAAVSDAWEAPGGRIVDQVAMVTCEPNADVRGIHHRMGVILQPEQFEIWLNGSPEEASELMVPANNGSLQVEEAIDVDWAAP
ncbi:MAG: SOS response-associated peptidase [Boseongicola sp.]